MKFNIIMKLYITLNKNFSKLIIKSYHCARKNSHKSLKVMAILNTSNYQNFSISKSSNRFLKNPLNL